MRARYAMLALAVVGCWVVPALAAKNGATMTRRDIRAMPILERPSRPGHFYGNTVRRSYARQTNPSWPGKVEPLH